MVKPRVVETDHGIQGEFNVQIYNQMQRRFRDRGWMETNAIIASGIDTGIVLEIGPGPGYLGLEWLKSTEKTELRAIEISPDMIAIAKANAREYGLEDRVRYTQDNAEKLPFEDITFDAVFTNSSLHEWSNPKRIFNEMYRVLKPGGKYFVSDLRRDINPFVKWFMYLVSKPKEIRPGLITSLRASYTATEIKTMLQTTNLRNAIIRKNLMGIEIIGAKEK